MTGQVLHRIQIAQGPAPGQLDVPRDLAVAANGTVYIADAGNPRIVVVSGAGRYLGSWDL
jgi:DNA-binding beta-propeller fold protein YncE